MRNSYRYLFVLVVFVPHFTAAQIIISEIMYDVSGSDSKAEWVELQNVGTTAIDISKWKINDGSNHVFNPAPKNGSKGSLMLSPGAFLILTADAPTFLSAHKSIGVSVIDTVLSLSNAGGNLALYDASSTLMDSASYSKEGGANGNGESLQKINGAFVPGTPTPGTTNSATRLPSTVVDKAPAPSKIAIKKTKAHEASPSTSPEKAVEEKIPETDTSVIPRVENSDSLFSSPWAYGALGTALLGAGAAFVAGRKKKDEWDIVEED